MQPEVKNENTLDNEVNFWGTSKYCDLSEICETSKKYGTDGFTIVHVNVTIVHVSLSKNLFKLEDLVTQLEALPDSNNTNFMYNTNLYGYKYAHVDTDKNARGVGLYVKEHIEFLVLNNVNIENEDCENLWVELKLNQKKYAIGVIYRHPTPNFEAFSERLFSVITDFNNTNYTYYICGDFNINLVIYPSEKNVSDYVDIYICLRINYIMVRCPKSLTISSKTFLIFIYTKPDSLKTKIILCKQSLQILEKKYFLYRGCTLEKN